jgi:alpha-beta hydrolase superfamily lysophospholipase
MEFTSRSVAERLRRYRRPLRWVAGISAVLLVLHLAGGWYFSSQIYSSALEPDPSTTDLETPVLAIDSESITLATDDGPDELAIPAVWGLAWENGYGQLTELIATGGEEATWRLRVIVGSAPQPGDLTDLDVRTFPDDPLVAHGIAFTDVTYTSGLGDNPAWYIEGDRPTWVVLVHGNGLTRRDVLKPLPTIVGAGYPALVITYRNHPLAPEDPSGRLQYGLTEWADVEAAVDYAITEGAEDVVLVGYSMGGGIVTNFLYESPLATRVRGIVLDAPMLDLSAAVDLGADDRSLPLIGLPIPGTLTATAKWIAGWRYDVEWGNLDYLERADEIDVPILLFHGADDDIVPVGTSDELASLRPDLVTYQRVEGAQHLESWNLDPAEYERLLGQFLVAISEATE